MKKKSIFILFCMLFNTSLNLLAKTYPDTQKNQPYPLVYVIMIASPEDEKQANVLVNSISTFGGSYSSAPVVIVLSDTAKTRGESLNGKVKELLVLKMNENLRKFPFADKVYACAQVEELLDGKTDWLIWLNPDALMVAPPKEITKDKNAWASLRPAHIQNIGSAYNEPISEYWKKLYKQAKVDTSSLWNVESYVDNKKIRPYYNSGCMAFNPSKGILREWRKQFELLLNDEKNFTFYASDNYGAFFMHQALLGAIVIARVGKERINILPPSYGYPLSQQKRDDFINKKHSLSEMKIILCEDYNYLQSLTIEEPFKTWLNKTIK